MFKQIILLSLLPLLLWARVETQKPFPLITPEPKQVTQENSPVEPSTPNMENLSHEERQIILQNKMVEETINSINDESFLTTFDNGETYAKELALLANKININRRAHNTLAVMRDQVATLILKNKQTYENTLKQIILAKREFRDKEYFISLLKNSIERINQTPFETYKATYEKESLNTEPRNENNYISKDFIKNYIELYNQKHTQEFILEYLLENIQKFRKTNFFIDEFNLHFFVQKIDAIKGISFISSLTSYHLKFSIGEIVMVVLILGFFRLLNLKIIAFLVRLINELFIRHEDKEEREEIREYLKKSITIPLTYALYVLGVQLSMYILIQDPSIIESIMPWINTVYMTLFVWAVYSVLANSITVYAPSLLEKYPNVRKDMIIFLLKMFKVLLAILVLLFLFTQLGIDIKAIAASLGIGGIAIALASKDTLTNFFGSLSIMADNSFSQGDWIQVDAYEGTVVDIRMRTTRIRTFENAMITIPNSTLANTHIQNWSKRKIGRRIKMSLGITYESKMEDIIQLRSDIHEMLKNHPGIATESGGMTKRKRFEATKREDVQGVKRKLLVYIDEFGASSVNILIYCFSRSPVWEEWLETKEDVLVKIAALVKKNNCDFAYPTQALWLKKGE